MKTLYKICVEQTDVHPGVCTCLYKTGERTPLMAVYAEPTDEIAAEMGKFLHEYLTGTGESIFAKAVSA